MSENRAPLIEPWVDRYVGLQRDMMLWCQKASDEDLRDVLDTGQRGQGFSASVTAATDLLIGEVLREQGYRRRHGSRETTDD